MTSTNKTEIDNITVFAKDNIKYARLIAKCILENNGEKNIESLYVIDSIIKRLGGIYKMLFSNDFLIRKFSDIFKSVEPNVRLKMFKLRNTWNGVILVHVLLALDEEIAKFDPAWPVMKSEKVSFYSNFTKFQNIYQKKYLFHKKYI